MQKSKMNNLGNIINEVREISYTVAKTKQNINKAQTNQLQEHKATYLQQRLNKIKTMEVCDNLAVWSGLTIFRTQV